MKSSFKVDPNRIQIFHELKKRRVYVGELIYEKNRDVYELHYDKHYVNSKNAIPIGPDLDLFKIVHTSKKGKLFPVFLDRIPENTNPAYNDYCNSEGISPDEKNPIILLGSIGARGPSSFVFERVYETDFSADEVLKMRKALQITQHDFAIAFDVKQVTLQRIESRRGSDKNTIKLLQIYFNFPEVALWQLGQGGAGIHDAVLSKLIQYFEKKCIVKQKILEVFRRVSGKSFFEHEVLSLIEKIFFLDSLERYKKLLKNFFSCNKSSQFTSLLFEIFFACDFEKSGIGLDYEVKINSSSQASVDFSCKIEGENVHFELVHLGQAQTITENIKNQEELKGYSFLSFGNTEIKDILIRLQNKLLEKCQNKDGKEHKFPKLSPRNHHIIVVNIEKQLPSAFDIRDCCHILYGDKSLEEECRLGLSGLFEQPDLLNSKFQDKFKIFRENISAVLFVKRNSFDNGLIMPRLEYLLIRNTQIHSQELEKICKNLGKILPEWKKGA